MNRKRALELLAKFADWYVNNSIPDFEDEAQVSGVEFAEALDVAIEELKK